MGKSEWEQMAEQVSGTLRLKTLPVGVKFLKDSSEAPEKARSPAVVLGKKITVCQGITLARVYGWTVSLTKDDLICLPALLAFGFTSTPDPAGALARLFDSIDFGKDAAAAMREVESIDRFETGEFRAMVMAPLGKGLFDPDTVLLYGNPAQMMRIVQAMVFSSERRISGNFGGKVECSEYLISPYKKHAPKISLPGMGDRIFSMTQDDEMVFSLPGSLMAALSHGLAESGKTIGARYPVTFYQNFQPEFPKQHIQLGKELGIF